MTKASSSRISLSIAFLLAATLGVCGASAQPSADDPLVGVWQGTVHHSKIGDVEFYFTIGKKAAAVYMAQVDIPAQKARNVPANEVRFDSPILVIDISSFGLLYEGKAAPDFSRIEGELKVGDEVLPLELKRSSGVPEAGRPQDPQKPYPYEEAEVTFPNEEAGIHLSGTLTLPSGPGPFPAAVLVSGSGPQDRDSTLSGHRTFLVVADDLTRRGMAVLRYDDRGVLKSEGDFHQATTADFATDARAAWAFLARHPRIDGQNIGFVGHSEGALISAMVAAAERDVAFVVLLAGTGVAGERLARMQSEAISRSRGAGEEAILKQTRMNEQIFRVFKTQEDPQRAEADMRRIVADSLKGMTDPEKKELNVSQESLAQDIKGYMADYPWARFFMIYDPATDLRKVRCPVLALNGDKDTQVPADINLAGIEEALKEAGNSDYEMKKLPGLNHLFQTAPTGHPREYGRIEETFSPAVLRLIADWILRAIRKEETNIEDGVCGCGHSEKNRIPASEEGRKTRCSRESCGFAGRIVSRIESSGVPLMLP